MSAGSTFNRPGILDATLIAAGCHHDGGDECARLYGFKAEGIAIPFRDRRGDAIMDAEKPFARVRLYHATDTQKYSQRSGSGVHVFIPPGFKQRAKGSPVILIEGEFKALSIDEAGYCALGLCGFNGAARAVERKDGRGHELHNELAELLAEHQPATLVFAGDADVVFNSHFATEAAKLRELIFGSRRFPFIERLIVVKPPVDGPKGFDDVRAAQGGYFNAIFDTLLTSGMEIEAKATSVEVFCALLKRETEPLCKLLSGDTNDAHRLRVKLLNSAAALWKETGAKLTLKPLLAQLLDKKESAIAGLVGDATCNRQTITKSRREAARRTPGQHKTEQVTPAQWFATKFPKLADEFGDAILEETDKDGIVSARDIGEDFLAATLGHTGSPDAPTVFLPTEDKFYTYLPSEGIFVQQRDPVLLARLSRLLLDCARQCRHNCQINALEFRFRDSASLSGVLKKARGLLETSHDFFSSDLTEYIPCDNGMLRLKDKTLLPFNPSYRRRNKLGVAFAPAAGCPMFLDILMRPALGDDDLDLLQRWCGLALIGENVAQVIMLLTGTAGGGKGTFIRVLIGIIGQTNLASLRTQLLGERFEIGRFLGKTLLYGADVPENFLNQRGASVLKSLTGVDLATPEFKNSNETPSILCKFNVIATSNSRLTVHLEGDVDAWRRRLRVIEYRNPKPEKVIANLDQEILQKEAAGVLNWMLEGLDKLRADGWQLRLSTNQQAVVDNLLLESDGHAVFARECLHREASQSLTVPDCFAAYVEFCSDHGWTALTKNKFGALIADVMVRQFGVTQSHNLLDAGGSPQRGWRGIGIGGKSSRPTDETVSQVSQPPSRDGWDTSSQVQPARIFPDREEIMLL